MNGGAGRGDDGTGGAKIKATNRQAKVKADEEAKPRRVMSAQIC